MPPARHLDELARRKEAVRARIALHREACAAAAVELARPLALVDQGLRLWRAVPAPARWTGVAAAFFATRKLSRGVGGLRSMLRYVPMAVQAFQAVKRFRASRTAASGAG